MLDIDEVLDMSFDEGTRGEELTLATIEYSGGMSTSKSLKALVSSRLSSLSNVMISNVMKILCDNRTFWRTVALGDSRAGMAPDSWKISNQFQCPVSDAFRFFLRKVANSVAEGGVRQSPSQS